MPVEPVEPVEPAVPVELVEPVEPVEPVVPVRGQCGKFYLQYFLCVVVGPQCHLLRVSAECFICSIVCTAAHISLLNMSRRHTMKLVKLHQRSRRRISP